MQGKRPLISFFSVSKTYGDDPLDYKSLVLKNIYLDIHPGEFVIIFGPSGSGKSTLLNLMAGLEFPTAGKVMVRGHNLSHFESQELAQYHRLKMGMVFQSFNLVKSLNVWENVALPQTASGVRYSLRKHRALRVLKLLNIQDYASRRVTEISGGEQQRVAIARALINNPFFLLVDEPTGNLDSQAAQEVMDILQGLNQHGKHTIVLVTHNPDYLHYASRIIYFQDGKIVKQDTHSEEGQNASTTDQVPTYDLNKLQQTTSPIITSVSDANIIDTTKTDAATSFWAPAGQLPPGIPPPTTPPVQGVTPIITPPTSQASAEADVAANALASPEAFASYSEPGDSQAVPPQQPVDQSPAPTPEPTVVSNSQRQP